MSRATARPLSPHLTIYRWSPHMLVSTLHRLCGIGLALFGTLMFIWWLAALAGGAESYASFHYWVVRAADGDTMGGAANLLSRVVALGLTWAFFQHLANGIRHFVMDMGAGFELKINRLGALTTLAFSVVATLATWSYICMRGIW